MQKNIATIFLLLCICYFPLFLHLDSLSLFPFDEARLAVNAQEMIDTGDFIVTHFGGKPDMWNCKPPLMIWLQVLSMKIFGVNELGTRFPAALSAFFTLFFIGYFSWHFLERKILGICSILVLICTPGYITTHVTRTGDYDALLILFSILFLFSVFELVHSSDNRKKKRLFLWASLWLSLAVLTKSVTGLLFLPAVAIYFTWKKTWIPIFRSPYLYYGLGIFIVLVGSYYGLREHYNPGYLQAVWKNELGGRYFEVLEDHQAPFSFYIKNSWRGKFLPWLFFLPLSLMIVWQKKGKERDFFSFLLLVVISFLLLISVSKTKLEWYDAPVYPLLAILVASGIESLYLFLKEKIQVNPIILFLVFCIAVFGMPYRNILASVYLPTHNHPMNYYAGFMKKLPEYKNYTLVSMSHNAQITFYKKVYNEKGYQLSQKFPNQLQVGETAMICEEEARDSMNSQFEYIVLEEWRTCRLVRIIGRLE
jgi:4-amino-4-deoxy-L-arabinose transferase-like glycosyltransferase